MSKFKLHYKKHPLIDLPVLGKQYSESHDITPVYNPYYIKQLQQYQPLYKIFFEMNQNNFESVSLNQKYQIVDLNHVQEDDKITIKKPIFKVKNNIYYDEDFKQFFMPKKLNLPTLIVPKDDLKGVVLKQAKLIKNNIENLKSLNYSNLSGWKIVTDKVVVKIGKSDIDKRLKLLKKITNNLKQSNLNVINLDLRYQQGYVLKI